MAKRELDKPYTCTALPRRAGKYAYAIRKALDAGGTIAVTREDTRRRILQTARQLHMPVPEVVVIDPARPKPSPSVTLIIIDYDSTKE